MKNSLSPPSSYGIIEVGKGDIAMLCPYCSIEMEDGFLFCASNSRMYWGAENSTYYSDTSFDVSETKPSLFSTEENRLTTHYCSSCDLLLAYRPKREKVTAAYWAAQAKASANRLIKKLKKEDF